MPCTPEQSAALDAWREGANVRVQAYPGAGKSWFIVQALKVHDGGMQVVLAYNKQLAADTQRLIDDAGLKERVKCFTFHGLVSHCVELAADDVALESALTRAEKKQAAVRRICVSALLVDEAQDVNDLHLRAMQACLVLGVGTQILVVGDSEQRLYDYGEYPARVDFFADPSEHFKSKRRWHRSTFSVSHRVTVAIARLLSAHFDLVMSSACPRASVPIRVHLTSKWRLGEEISSMLHGNPERTMLLSSTIRGNFALRLALNWLSGRGVALHVHGQHGDEVLRRGKLRVSSWHATKGTECDTTIVLMPGRAERNPLFVAWSRSRQRMHVVFLEDEVDTQALGTLCDLHLSDESTVDFGKDKHKVAQYMAAAGGEEKTVSSVRCLDHWRADARVLKRIAPAARPSTEDGGCTPVVAINAVSEDVSAIYAAATRLKAEYEQTGMVRSVRDVLFPVRLSHEQQCCAIRGGSHARFVGTKMPLEWLLSDDLVAKVRRAYERRSAADWCTLGAATLAWNAYHHVMRQVLPTESWADAELLEGACARLLARMRGEEEVTYDVRLSRVGADERLVHARAHAVSRRCAWHFVWLEPTSAERAEAVVRATLHSARACTLLTLHSDSEEVHMADDGLLHELTF